MATFKKDMNKLTYEEIEAKPGRLAVKLFLISCMIMIFICGLLAILKGINFIL